MEKRQTARAPPINNYFLQKIIMHTPAVIMKRASMPPRLRMAVFGSFRRGEAMVMKAIELKNQYPDQIELCFIATDNPERVNMSQRRIWRYVADIAGERNLLAKLAKDNGIPFWDGSIKGKAFQQAFRRYSPDICYMGTFGQKIPAHIFNGVPLGFFNFHPCIDGRWPSAVGGDPFEQMIKLKTPYCAIAMHEVNDRWDDGALVSMSRPYPIGPNDTPFSLHSKTAAGAAELMHWHVLEKLGLMHPSLKGVLPYPRLSTHAKTTVKSCHA
jgi:hypothetical protein